MIVLVLRSLVRGIVKGRSPAVVAVQLGLGFSFLSSLFHAVTDGLTIAAAGVAIGMAVPEERQAAAQGLMGAAQALVAGVTAVVIGIVYDGGGRLAAYATTAAGMVLLTALGWSLGRRSGLARPLRRRAASV